MTKSIHDRKKISFEDLKVGMEIKSYRKNRWCLCSDLFINKIEGTTISFNNKWNEPCRILEDADQYVYEVELTDEEIADKYHSDVEILKEALNNQLAAVDGCHEMYNGWLYAGSLTEVASKLREEKMTVIGYATLIQPKTSWFGELLDIGVVAEYEDGDRIWCHASDKFRKQLLAGKYGE